MQIFVAIAMLGAWMFAGHAAFAQDASPDSSSLKAKKNSKTKEPAKLASAAAGSGGVDWRANVNPAINPDEYSVGEADVLHINVWKEPELTENVVVRPDGKISMPLVSEIKVGGMTPSQIQQLLT
jgi:polysaccharide export outer membrane protein